MPHIRTETLIDAPPRAVWDVLADFNRYHEWNPLNVEASGEARLGARIPMTFRNPAARAPDAVMRMTVTITACEPGRRLAWLGVVPLLFRGLHAFTLSQAAGATRLVHEEHQSGLIPMTFSAALIRDGFTPLYDATNRALAGRVAALAASSKSDEPT